MLTFKNFGRAQLAPCVVFITTYVVSANERHVHLVGK